jgi:hypothetical protein
VYLTAKAWTVRPSALLEITDSLHAYQIDEVVAMFGANVEAEMSLVEGKTTDEVIMKRTMVLNKILGTEQKFRDPMEVISNG